jgi:hypothetical protein
MKKIMLFMLTAMLTTAAAAQTKDWKIALHVDPNISWLKPDNNNLSAGSNKVNFGFGVSIDRMFTENYAIGTGIQIFNTGGVLSYFRTDIAEGADATNTQTVEYPSISQVNRTYNLKYLEIPLTLKLRTNEIGYITYWAQVGVGAGFNIKAKSDDEIDHKKINTATIETPIWEDAATRVVDQTGDNALIDNDIAKEISLPRAGLIVGGGIEYNLSGDASIVAGVIFNNGFTNVLKGDGVKVDSGEPSIKENKAQPFDLKAISNVLSLQVGILF